MPDTIYPVHAPLDDHAADKLIEDYQITSSPGQYIDLIVVGKMTEDTFQSLVGSDDNIATYLSTTIKTMTNTTVTIDMSFVASEHNPDGVQAKLIASFADQTGRDQGALKNKARKVRDLEPETALKLINIGCDIPPGSSQHAIKKTLDNIIEQQTIVLDDLIYVDNFEEEI